MEPVLAVDIGAVFEPAKDFSQLGPLVTVIVRNAFVFAGIIAFVLLIFGGFGIIVGAGAGDTKQIESGKKTIVGAIIGLILVVGSVWMIQILEGVTGVSLLPLQ